MEKPNYSVGQKSVLPTGDQKRFLARCRRGCVGDSLLRYFLNLGFLIDPTIAVHHGRVVKRTGDAGSLVEFRSAVGSPMTAIAIYDRIRKHTREAFGTVLNPHLFRDAAATTLAIADPENVRVAAPLLGHRTFTRTERYYQQAKSFEAHRQYITSLFGQHKVS
jgi:hypothetical protein